MIRRAGDPDVLCILNRARKLSRYHHISSASFASTTEVDDHFCCPPSPACLSCTNNSPYFSPVCDASPSFLSPTPVSVIDIQPMYNAHSAHLNLIDPVGHLRLLQHSSRQPRSPPPPHSKSPRIRGNQRKISPCLLTRPTTAGNYGKTDISFFFPSLCLVLLCPPPPSK